MFTLTVISFVVTQAASRLRPNEVSENEGCSDEQPSFCRWEVQTVSLPSQPA